MENDRNPNIIELSDFQTGDTLTGCLLIKSSEILTTKTGSPYLKLTLTDGHTDICWVVWNFSDETKFPQKTIVFINGGTLSDYNGTPQLKADLSFVEPLAETDYPTYHLTGPDDFTFQVISPDDLRMQAITLIDQIKSPVLQNLVRGMINSTGGEYYRHPAAQSMHHAFVGGLAFHSISMAKVLLAQADVYTEMNQNRPDFHINRDLLIAAALVHDIGKVYEMTPAPDTSYTEAGNLLGHVIIGNNILIKVAEKQGIKTGNEELMLLEHMLLSHHGRLEWGAPVQPKTLEAIMLHQVDASDARTEMAEEHLENVSEGGTSKNKVFGLDGIYLYHPKEK